MLVGGLPDLYWDNVEMMGVIEVGPVVSVKDGLLGQGGVTEQKLLSLCPQPFSDNVRNHLQVFHEKEESEGAHNFWFIESRRVEQEKRSISVHCCNIVVDLA